MAAILAGQEVLSMLKKRNAAWLVVAALAVLCLQMAAQTDKPEPKVLCESAFTIAAHSSKDCAFTVTEGMKVAKIVGHFSATGGPHNSIEVWVLDDDAFVNWRNHRHVTALYNSEKVTQGTIDLTLPHPGKYRRGRGGEAIHSDHR
jgi:hypothetical protein